MESCDNIVVSIGYMGDGNGNMMGRRRRAIDDVDSMTMFKSIVLRGPVSSVVIPR